MTAAFILCMALVMHNEARGEDLLGQLKVGHVLLNRAEGNTKRVCHEAYKPYQFSVAKKTTTKMVRTARLAWDLWKGGNDLTDGATHFHSGRQPYWAKHMRLTVKHGGHWFYDSRM